MKLLKSRTRLAAAIGLAGLVTVLVAGPAGAATTNITIVNLSFGPTVTVHAGDTVVWTNGETPASQIPHTVSSDTGAFGSALLNPGNSFSHTFATAGNFAYHCNVHSSMHGMIVVQAVTTTTTPSGPTTTKAASVGGTTVTTAASSSGAPLATTGPGHATLLVELAVGLLLSGLLAMAATRRRQPQD